MAKKNEDFVGKLVKQLFCLIVAVIQGLFSSAKTKGSNAGRNTKRSFSPSKEKVTAVASDVFSWPSTNDFEFEIVGEASYQASIAKLAGQHGQGSASAQFVAALIPEVHPADHLAVRVQAVGGDTVGYLSRDDARSYRRRLSGKKLGGQITTCMAMVSGGGTAQSGEIYRYGVRLAIKPFE